MAAVTSVIELPRITIALVNMNAGSAYDRDATIPILTAITIMAVAASLFVNDGTRTKTSLPIWDRVLLATQSNASITMATTNR